jgi:hypothetical protein
MSLTWQEWETDILEREKAFEPGPIRRRLESSAPWTFWDWCIAAVLFLFVLGCLGVWIGDLTA